jgi:hypothetical protein
MLTNDTLTNKDDLDSLQVTLVVDPPADEVAWLCQPAGAEHWSHATAAEETDRGDVAQRELPCGTATFAVRC